MGIAESKVAQEDKEEVATRSVPTTPILTPKQKCVEVIMDPRSPSLHILRTPVTSTGSPLTPTPDTCDTFNINSPMLTKNLDDPRSPTMAFNRTPITAAAVEETDLLKRVHMKNLHNIKKVISEMPSQIPPKLLESSPIKHKPNENKRKSFAGLLETNLDYVETDLDAVILSKSSTNVVKYISPSKSELKTKFLETLQKDETEEQTKSAEPVITSTLVQIEDTVDKQEIAEINESVQTVVQNLLEDVADDGLIILPAVQAVQTVDEAAAGPEIVLVTPKKTETGHNPQPEPDTVTAVNEFETKVNQLIYTEEEHITTTPPVNKNALQAKTASKRTPLGTRNGNNAKASFKTKPKLRVSDKPRRADYAVSKIPVFSTKNKAQCENTPPRKMLAKGRRAQWDNDNTLLI